MKTMAERNNLVQSASLTAVGYVAGKKVSKDK